MGVGTLVKARRVKETFLQARISPRLEPGNFRRISREAKLAPQHVSRVLRGLKGCSFDAAERIARAAGVTMDDFRSHLAAIKAQNAFVAASDDTSPEVKDI